MEDTSLAGVTESAPQTTGDTEVDQVLQGLLELPDLPLNAHVHIFETVQDQLQDHLSRTED